MAADLSVRRRLIYRVRSVGTNVQLLAQQALGAVQAVALIAQHEAEAVLAVLSICLGLPRAQAPTARLRVSTGLEALTSRPRARGEMETLWLSVTRFGSTLVAGTIVVWRSLARGDSKASLAEALRAITVSATAAMVR